MTRRARGPLFGALFALLVASGCQCDTGPVGHHLQGSIEVTPTEVDFGPVAVGQTASQTLSLHNTGNFALDLTGFAATAPFGTEEADQSLGQLDTTEITVTLTPEAEGEVTGTLTFATTDPEAPTVTVALRGVGTEAGLVVEPELVDFGDVLWQVASSTAYLPVTVRSTGTHPVEITGLELTDDGGGAFDLDPKDAQRSYAPGESGTFEVSFLAKALGPASGTLRIATTARTQPEIVVPLQATAVGPAAQVCVALDGAAETCTPDALALDFGPVVKDTTAFGTLTVHNTGTEDLRLSGLRLAGADTDYAVSPALPSGGQVLAPDETGTWDVGYTPSNFGSDGANLSVITNDRARPGVLVALSGRARRPDLEVDPGGITISMPSAISHQEQPVDLYNCGDDPLTLTEVTMTQTLGAAGALTVVGAPPAGTVLEPLGLNCVDTSAPQVTVQITFDSTTPGNYTGELTVRSDDPLDPQVVVDVAVDKR